MGGAERSAKGSRAAAVGGALLTAPLVAHAAASQFDGSYNDPNRPYCLRVIQVPGDNNMKAKISGTDGTPDCAADGSGGIDWSLTGKVKGDTILVDFQAREGGPKNVKGTLNQDGSISWPDGNTWTRKVQPVGGTSSKLVESGV